MSTVYHTILVSEEDYEIIKQNYTVYDFILSDITAVSETDDVLNRIEFHQSRIKSFLYGKKCDERDELLRG